MFLCGNPWQAFYGITTTTRPVPLLLDHLGNFALQFFGGATAALGNIVLVFAILERVLPSSELDESKDDWKPSDLLAEPDPEHG